ncbi:hypothetical protein [Thiohalomonas denitrificans]|uniref:Uncharacterized protein n=1 Tax=Thiohalomonas denitrificans TaxID=415747 RepID=A0A1G5PRM9_9GAMM|nr:hypothetical protein [Thiohalomonas denitrificans]SCZ51871.1 hypothetical protein SAMN03097708_00609 [Thiohalomonas denitrificans]
MSRIEPDPYSSIEYHLYKLENLFQTLHDLWEAKRQGMRVGHRWLLALTGFSGMGRTVPETPNAFPITLEVGSRICNTAIEALVDDQARHPQTAECHERVTADIRYMRDLLIALHDLTETNGCQRDYPLEHDTARLMLATLIGKPPGTADDDLVDACFTCGQRTATHTITLMQQAH